jgi:hypothetical protein
MPQRFRKDGTGERIEDSETKGNPPIPWPWPVCYKGAPTSRIDILMLRCEDAAKRTRRTAVGQVNPTSPAMLASESEGKKSVWIPVAAPKA